MITIRLED